MRRIFYIFLIAGYLLPAQVLADVPKPTSRDQMESLDQLMRYVHRNYYADTDAVELFHGAIEGYLAKLDPHSTYIRPEELHDAQERLRGSFEGIGIFFEMVDGVLTVLSPIEGSPAFLVGLLPGDQIYKIDGKSALGLKSKEVTDQLKGAKGTAVAVSVRRESEPDLLEFEIVRNQILVPSVPYAFKLTPDVGYVKIVRFASRTGEELEAALMDLLSQGVQKLILDLRGNGGGYLEQAVVVANHFLERGRLLVYTQGRQVSSREDHLAEREPVFAPDLPLIVLVDAYSASASEIVAGAVQDYDRGLVAGHTTFGKGLVQKQFPLRNNGAILLTIARYFTPSDRPIQRAFTDDREAYHREAGHGAADASKQVYYTRILKRKVYGDGGIAPDVALASDSLSALSRRLLNQKHFPAFLAFAKQQEKAIAGAHPDFESFFMSYKPSNQDMMAFQALLQAREVSFTEKEFQESADFIAKQIKQQIAQIRWGARAEGQVRVHHDAQVEQALALFGQAEALLAARMEHYNSGRAYGQVEHNQVR